MIIIIRALALCTLALLVSCHGEEHHEAKTTFMITKPWRKSLTVDTRFVGQIRAVQHIELRAFEKGYLQEIFVDEGQLIKKGQKMFQIMPFLNKAEFGKAKAEFDISQIEYTQTQTLAKKKVVSLNELALAKAKFDKATANMELAKTHLDMTLVSAPFDGIMDRFRVRLGSLVEEGELLTTLSDNSKLWVYFNVSERDYLNYMAQRKKDGKTEVRLMLANNTMFDQVGNIETIEADFDNATGNVAFRATFANPDGILRHGETGNVVMTEQLNDVLVIPQKATFEVLDKRYVYVVGKGGKLEAREIVVERDVPHLFIVKSGVTEEDAVLMEGIGKVKKGDVIKTRMETSENVMKSLELAAY